jgi:energy-coupling factor transporter ATP-binding protein EcfA2
MPLVIDRETAALDPNGIGKSTIATTTNGIQASE